VRAALATRPFPTLGRVVVVAPRESLGQRVLPERQARLVAAAPRELLGQRVLLERQARLVAAAAQPVTLGAPGRRALLE
jgi:hypothetical protein